MPLKLVHARRPSRVSGKLIRSSDMVSTRGTNTKTKAGRKKLSDRIKGMRTRIKNYKN